MQEEQFIQETWNKQRIFIAVTIVLALVGLAYGTKTLVLDKNKQVEGIVEGAKTENTTPASFSLPKKEEIRTNIQQKMEALQEQVTNLDAIEIASSSPQVQKILQDLKALEEYPKSQAKQMCENVCKNL